MKRQSLPVLMGSVALACIACTVSCRSRDDGVGRPPMVRAQPIFVTGPIMERVGTDVIISFTAGTVGNTGARPAAGGVDATVEAIDADGRVIRHIASGLLGTEAPAPFAKGTLTQRLVWDGRDDKGNPAPAPTRVRVGLGLKPVFDRAITWEDPGIYSRGVVGLTCGPDGTLYVTQGRIWQKSCGWPEIVAFSRDGQYLRTILPWRADIRPKDAPEAEISRLPDGTVSFKRTYPTGVGRQGRQGMCVAGDRLLLLPGDGVPGVPGAARPYEERRAHSLGLDGVTGPRYYGPLLPAGHKASSFATFLAATADGNTVYLAGASAGRDKLHHAVYRAAWSDRQFEPFLGERKVPGSDDSHFNDPRGLALDAAGRLYVCDFGNDRIQVFAPGGELVRSIAIAGPEQIAVHPRTGAIYVLSVRDKSREEMHTDVTHGVYVVEPTYQFKAVVKLSSVEEGAKPVAGLDLPDRKLHMHDAAPIMAVDTSGPEAQIWVSSVGRQLPEDYLWLIADKGAALERKKTPIARYRWPFGIGRGGTLAVDRARDEVYIAGWEVPYVMRVNGRSGKVERLEKVTQDIQTKLDGTAPEQPTDHPQVAALAVDARGLLYVRLMGPWSGNENWLRRYDREGNRVPFEAAGDQLVLNQPSHGYHFVGASIGPDGNIYLINLAPGAKARNDTEYNVLDVYGPDGKLKRAALMPFLTSGAWGPRFGPDGSMYFTEAVRPRDGGEPDEGYGSLVKFRPGRAELRYGKNVNSETARYEIRRRSAWRSSSPPDYGMAQADFEGLDWLYYGVHPVPWGHCVCPFAAFDIDGHGRACVPEQDRHRATLLDSAGNPIVRFGSYGNRDSLGPGSPVPVPDVPLWLPQAIALSDDAVYIFDRNRRVVRARWDYLCQEVLPVP